MEFNVCYPFKLNNLSSVATYYLNKGRQNIVQDFLAP